VRVGDECWESHGVGKEKKKNKSVFAYPVIDEKEKREEKR